MRTVLGILLIVAGTSAADFLPARRISGSLPGLPPPKTIGWVEETVELEVDLKGRVDRATLLNAASRGPSLVVPAVADWRFKPALDHREPVASRVLVAAMFRPPTLYDNAPAIPPAEYAAPSNEIPFPVVTKRPLYPVQAIADGVVLVEVLVGPDGRVRETTFRGGERAFETVALEAARDWSFRPAKRNDQLVEAFAYLAFGFRRPVTSAK